MGRSRSLSYLDVRGASFFGWKTCMQASASKRAREELKPKEAKWKEEWIKQAENWDQKRTEEKAAQIQSGCERMQKKQSSSILASRGSGSCTSYLPADDLDDAEFVANWTHASIKK